MLSLKIISPERTLLNEQVNQVNMNTDVGELTILPGHVPVVVTLKPGELRFIQNKETIPVVVLGGFVEITPEAVTILADSAEKVEEIIEERVLEAKKQAEELRQQKIEDKQDYAALTAVIEKELTRLKIAQKYKKR